MAANPSASLPQIFIEKQDLDNTYSFLSNDGVEEAALWDAHREGTVKRCKDYKEILVIHDTTEFAFDDFGFERQYLSQISANRQGFYSHCSIAVSNETNPMPLGTLNTIHFVHKEQVGEETAKWWEERGGLLENEHDRWLQGCSSCVRMCIWHIEKMGAVPMEPPHSYDRTRGRSQPSATGSTRWCPAASRSGSGLPSQRCGTSARG